LLNPGLEYALGNSGVDVKTLGPSEPNTYTSFGNTITTINTIKGLYNGKSHFLTFAVGLEFALHKNLASSLMFQFTRGSLISSGKRLNTI
jgi:hypothetical protein